jgi:hypothetical protein
MNNVLPKFRSSLVLGVGLISCGASLTSRGAVAVWDYATPATGPLTSYLASSKDAALVSGTPSLASTGGASVPEVAGGLLNYAYNGNHAADLNGVAWTITITALSGFALQDVTYTAGFTSLTAITGTWSYNISGGTPSSGTISPFETIAAGGNTDNLTSIPALTAGQNLTLTMVFSGAAGGNNGLLTFDNLTINAVPEPANVALVVFGLGAVGVVTGRRLYGRKRA